MADQQLGGPLALSLSVPAAEQNSARGLEIRPKQAKTWIESLPLTKINESARQVHEHLAAVNRAKIPAEERVALLEVYRPVLGTLLDELEHVFAYAPLPLTGRQHEAFELAQGLARECANAYKLFIVEKTGKMLAFGAKKAMPLPMFRAMQYVRHVMMQSYKTYYPIPAGTWEELHRLYAWCEENALLAEVPDPESKLSIQDLYVEAVLLALADPYRLMPKEAEKVLEILAQHRGLCVLGAGRPDGVEANRIFVVTLDSDRAPRLLTNAVKDPGGKQLRALDATAIVARLEQKLAAQGGNREALARSRATHDLIDLMQRLTRLWGDPPKRQFRRNAADSSVALCAGIKAVAHFAELALRENPMDEATAIAAGVTLPLLKLPDDPLSKKIGVEEWMVLNQSPSGLRLHREPGGTVAGSVGEVIGVRFLGATTWNVGVVRWLNMLDNNELEFGLELIAPIAEPIQIEPTIASNGRSNPALLLPRLLSEGEGEAVLAYPDTFSDLREFDLRGDRGTDTVRATTLIEKTARFDLFQFTPS